MRERPPAKEPWPLALVLVVANTAVFALQLLAHLRPESRLAFLERHAMLVPSELAHGAIWQLFTFQFLNGGLFHLVINCLMLYLFGRPMETLLGRRAFLQLYLGSGAVGGLLQAACSWMAPGHFGTFGTVGASCGVYGLLAAYALMNRERQITALVAFILPVSLKAKYLLVILLVLSGLGMLQGHGLVAHGGHLGGMLGGMAYVRFLLERGGIHWRWPRIQARRKTPRLIVLPSPRQTVSPRPPAEEIEDLPPEEFIQRAVDPILEKISRHGIQSLTPRERRILEQARKKMTRP